MSLIDLAELKARIRVFALYGFATASVALLVGILDTHQSFFTGVWMGMTLSSALFLTPFFARVKNSPLARLLDDEATREHRHTSSAVGLWAALLAGVFVVALGNVPGLVSSADGARIIITAAVAAALIAFATLEMRAAR